MPKQIKKIKIDRNICIGAAPCVSTAPEAFKLDAEGKATLLPGWKQVEDATLKQAAQACPVKAIFLYDQQDQQIYP